MANAGILSGETIKAAVKAGRIMIDPWSPTHVNEEDKLNPASYDLTLGDHVAVYEAVTGYRGVEGWPREVEDGEDGTNIGSVFPDFTRVLRVDRPNPVRRFRMPETGWLMKPGIGYLAHTLERVTTDDYVPIVDGKSSIGRLFVKVHETAGFGDPGYEGHYTLEMTCVHPIWVIPRMRICQIRFHSLVGDVKSYREKGTYRKELSEGPIPSQSWRMFPQKSDG